MTITLNNDGFLVLKQSVTDYKSTIINYIKEKMTIIFFSVKNMNDTADSAKGDVGDLLTGVTDYNAEIDYRKVAYEYYRRTRECKEYEWLWEDVHLPAADGICYLTRHQNCIAFGVLRKERLRRERRLPEQELITHMMGGAGDRVYMATINYPDKFTDFKFMEEIMIHLKEREWVKKIKWVHEYYTDKGNHPHTHVILTLYKKLSPRRLAESIYALKGIKKYCEGLNFVQVEKDFTRTWIDREDYINGVKKTAKLANVASDESWRAANFTPPQLL